MRQHCILDVQATDNLVEIIAMILLPLSVLMCAYALMVFVWRAQAIAKKQVCSLHGHVLCTASCLGPTLAKQGLASFVVVPSSASPGPEASLLMAHRWATLTIASGLWDWLLW